MKEYHTHKMFCGGSTKIRHIWTTALLQLFYTKSRRLRHSPYQIVAWLEKRNPILSEEGKP